MEAIIILCNYLITNITIKLGQKAHGAVFWRGAEGRTPEAGI